MDIPFSVYMKTLSEKSIATSDINSNIRGYELISILSHKEKKCLLLESEHINLL